MSALGSMKTGRSLMKKVLAILTVTVVMLSISGCGGAQVDQADKVRHADTPEAAISIMQDDITQTADGLTSDLEEAMNTAGDTYDSYTDKKQVLFDWFDKAASETEELGNRLRESGRSYFRLVVDTVDHADTDALNDALKQFQRDVYDRALDDYYETIYEDAFDEVYDAYHDGVLKDAYDVIPYGEWYDELSEFYTSWYDGKSDTYSALYDAKSNLYSDIYDVSSAFYSKEFDLDSVFEAVDDGKDDAKEADSDDEQSSVDAEKEDDLPTESSSESDTSSVSADFKQMMDAYEEFFNEYIDFIKAYSEDPTSAELLARYGDMMSQYSDAMEGISEIDQDSLTGADLDYYLEVYGRITQKLSEIPTN